MNAKEKGSVTLFVLVSMLFFVLFLTGMYLLSASREQTNYTETAKIKEIYEKDVNKVDDIYETIVSKRDILDEIKIGDTVSYTPPTSTDKTNIYNWQSEYCSSGIEDGAPAENRILTNTGDFKVTEWKVFDIDPATKEITLISAQPTTGKVYLGGAQGYNNAVKMLNDACSALYGNDAKGIKARSIKIEDIEDKIVNEAFQDIYSNVYKRLKIAYKSQVPTKYTTHKNYPVIYAKENLSVIDGVQNDNGLNISEQITLISRTENGANGGVISTAGSIQPYETYWLLAGDENFTTPTPKETFKSRDGVSYYDLIMGENTAYWVASRSVGAYSDICYFTIGVVDGNLMGPLRCVYLF